MTEPVAPRRRGWSAVAGLAAGALAVTGVTAAAMLTRPSDGRPSQGASTADRIVPFAALPALRPVHVAAGSAAPSTACTPRDLTAVAGPAGAWHGQATQLVRVTNVAARACSLADPSVSVRTAAGARQLATAPGATAGPLRLSSGDTAELTLGTPGTCRNAGSNETVYRTVELGLPGGGRLTVRDTYVNVTCGGVTVSELRTAPGPDRAPRGPLAALRATLGLPSAVAQGHTLRYTVRLANPTGSAIDLDPCPSYVQRLGAGVAEAAYALNCRPASRIPPYGSVTFAMWLELPAGAATGPQKLLWAVDDGPVAGGVVRISG